MKDPKSFKELETEWYTRLKKDGFEDIENTEKPDRPLKGWHAFRGKRIQLIQEKRTVYQKQIDDFINHPEFKGACKSMVKHGNCKFVQREVELIWELHVQGQTRRQIARRFSRSVGRINDVIWGLEKWLKIL